MSLTEEQIKRAMREVLAETENGISEEAMNDAINELEQHQLSAVLWDLWEGGYTAISWTIDDGLCWRSIKPYRAADALAE